MTSRGKKKIILMLHEDLQVHDFKEKITKTVNTYLFVFQNHLMFILIQEVHVPVLICYEYNCWTL